MTRVVRRLTQSRRPYTFYPECPSAGQSLIVNKREIDVICNYKPHDPFNPSFCGTHHFNGKNNCPLDGKTELTLMEYIASGIVEVIVNKVCAELESEIEK